MLKLGEVLVCTYGNFFPDGTTKGKEYKVSFVNGTCFKIYNDKGDSVMPIYSAFRKKVD